jgi:hypothetical protein
MKIIITILLVILISYIIYITYFNKKVISLATTKAVTTKAPTGTTSIIT